MGSLLFGSSVDENFFVICLEISDLRRFLSFSFEFIFDLLKSIFCLSLFHAIICLNFRPFLLFYHGFFHFLFFIGFKTICYFRIFLDQQKILIFNFYHFWHFFLITYISLPFPSMTSSSSFLFHFLYFTFNFKKIAISFTSSYLHSHRSSFFETNTGLSESLFWK